MSHKPKQDYLTKVCAGKKVTLSIVYARNALDAAAITGRAEGVPEGKVFPMLIDSKAAEKELRRWFKQRYVRAIQYGEAENYAEWRFTIRDLRG